jgi:hypothetical protein
MGPFKNDAYVSLSPQFFLLYTWNLEGKLRNLKRPPFRDIKPPFLFLCNYEDLSLPQVLSTLRLLCHLNQ